MKILVAYYSQTGNTRRVAEAIHAAVAGEKDLKPIEEVQSLDGYDLTFLGFPIHGGAPAGSARAFLEARCEGAYIALFVTHAAGENSKELFAVLDRCTAAAAGAQVLGVFNCQGELAPDVMEKFAGSSRPELRMLGEQGAYTRGLPDKARLERAAAFARQVVAKL